MLDINFLQKTRYFKKRTLEKGEYLFKEGENDNNIYIIIIGELKVLKYADNQNKKEEKEIAILKQNEIFGEASLNNNLPKKVSIKATRKTNLIYIDARNDLEELNKKYPDITLNLLKYIIYLSNNRLNFSNYLITASHKISEKIINLKDYSYKTIFNLIENIKEITNSSEIIFLEENMVVKGYFTIKYKTSKKGQMLDEIIKISDNKLNLLELKINGKYNYIQKLQIGNKNYGYLIFIKNKTNFTENEKKVFIILSSSFAGVLKQKNFLKEQLNKDYIKNN